MTRSLETPNQAATFECSACGATHHTARGLPVGWSAVLSQGLVWCGDCSATDIVRRTLNPRRAA